MMKGLVTGVFSVLLLTAAVGAQEKLKELPPLPAGVTNTGDPAKVKAVLAREEGLRKAYFDLDEAAAADFYAEEYFQIPMIKWCCLVSKREQMEQLIEHRDRQPPNPFTSITNDQVVVRVYGDTAVVTGVQTAIGSMKPPHPSRILFMNVWVLKKGKWRIVGASKKRLD